MNSSLCVIPECGLPHKARGWCTKHYSRWLRYGDPLHARHYVKGTAEDRFWAKVDKSGGDDACWPWLGACKETGYGIAEGDNDIFNHAHIVAYMFTFGEIPDGLQIDHTCHDSLVCNLGWDCPHRKCQNPKHLKAVTHAENHFRRRGGHQSKRNLDNRVDGSTIAT